MSLTVNSSNQDSPATRSAAVKYGDTQLAIFHVPKRGYYATQVGLLSSRATHLEQTLVANVPTQACIRP